MSLTVGGIVFMTVAWLIIIGLCTYCMIKVLRKHPGNQNQPD